MGYASLSPTHELPLLDRRADAALFLRSQGAVSAAGFLGAAARLASDLPDRPSALLSCTDRFGFALAFAAVVLRGQTAVLAERVPDCVAKPYRLGDREGNDCRFDPAALLSGKDWSGPPPMIDAERVVAIVATSGSTGQPVAHEKRFGALVQRSRAAGERFGLSEASPARIVGTVPPQHMYGFETTVLLPLHAGCASWCGPAFYPSDVQSAFAALAGPRMLVSTPLQLRAFLSAGLDLAPLDQVVSATAPIDCALAAAVEQRWNTRVLEIFGATELGSVATRRTVMGEIWEVYPGVALAAQGADIMVRAPHAPDARMDDAVEWSGGANFRLLGRRSDVVKLGGRRASLAGLNQILNALPGVSDGVFLAPDDLDSRSTARMLAFVVAPDHTPSELLRALRERIDPVFLPRRIVKLDRLPRNEIGKLPRQALASLAEV